jgi:hypothetical protein
LLRDCPPVPGVIFGASGLLVEPDVL